MCIRDRVEGPSPDKRPEPQQGPDGDGFPLGPPPAPVAPRPGTGGRRSRTSRLHDVQDAACGRRGLAHLEVTRTGGDCMTASAWGGARSHGIRWRQRRRVPAPRAMPGSGTSPPSSVQRAGPEADVHCQAFLKLPVCTPHSSRRPCAGWVPVSGANRVAKRCARKGSPLVTQRLHLHLSWRC